MTMAAARHAIPESDMDPFCDEFLGDPYPGHVQWRDTARRSGSRATASMPWRATPKSLPH